MRDLSRVESSHNQIDKNLFSEIMKEKGFRYFLSAQFNILILNMINILEFRALEIR